MAAEIREKLIEAALALRGAAPDEWAMFLEAMRANADDQINRCVECDIALLQRAQGMALVARELEIVFRTAPELYAKAQEKKKWPTKRTANPNF